MEIQKILKDTKETVNLSITDLSIEEITPNVIDDIVILIKDGKCEIDLPYGMNGEKFKIWKKGRGGLFLSDIRKILSNKTINNYVLLKGEGQKFIARLINEGDFEEEFFESVISKLVDGKIKDKLFIKIKDIEEDKNLFTTERYIVKEDADTATEIIINTPINTEDETTGNISLFKD